MTETNSFGSKLRLARERRGLSQEEAAKALCLNVEIINALETEQFDKLPAAVFVRGYIKNYASLLRLVINESPPVATSATVFSSPLEQGSVSQSETPTNTVLKSNSFKWLKSFNQLFFKLLNYLVIISLIILVCIWWHERHRAAEKTENLRSIINMSVEKIPFERLENTKPKELLPKFNKKPNVSKDVLKLVFPGWPL